MKDYLKPEVEIISLTAQEPITTDDDLFPEGELSTTSNPFD